ncbi:MAG: DUF6340 family protein [Marinilabiliales bacterium]
MSVQEPAPVFFPKTIKKVGLVNRTKPDEKNKILDDIEKILSVEGKNLDKEGAEQCVKGAFDELAKNQNIEEVKDLINVDVRTSSVGAFPSMLSWSSVEKICNENHVDALFVLEFYDTNTGVDYKTVQKEVEGPLGVKIPALEHHATVATSIKTGWRIYYPDAKEILDEFIMMDKTVSTGVGINPTVALEAVTGRKENVKMLSRNLGKAYAHRIVPYWIRVSRYYYVRGTDNFKIAKRRAQTGDWDGAAELWAKEIDNPKRKVAGRACYNMAIINEINGNLDEALSWAQKSYVDYKNKEALRYMNTLKYRKAKMEEIKMQQE